MRAMPNEQPGREHPASTINPSVRLLFDSYEAELSSGAEQRNSSTAHSWSAFFFRPLDTSVSPDV